MRPAEDGDGDFERESADGSPSEEGLDASRIERSDQTEGRCFDHLSYREGQAELASERTR